MARRLVRRDQFWRGVIDVKETEKVHLKKKKHFSSELSIQQHLYLLWNHLSPVRTPRYFDKHENHDAPMLVSKMIKTTPDFVFALLKDLNK